MGDPGKQKDLVEEALALTNTGRRPWECLLWICGGIRNFWDPKNYRSIGLSLKFGSLPDIQVFSQV